MRFLVAEKLGPHKFKTPEGYLICTDAILSRTGKQEYKRCEIFGDACDEPDKIVNVDRIDAEVFSDKAMASFENKPICIEHPDQDVNIENHNELSVGFIRDIHKGEDNGHPVMMGTLVITDKDAVEAVESGEYKELSCGYDCDIDDNDNPQQRNIRGNHVALCKQGRAGIARIVDSVDDADERQHIADAAVIMAGEHNDDGKYFYGYLSVDHPKLGNFYVSFKIKGRRREVQLDGTGWNFIKSKGYTTEQKRWIAQHKSDLERIGGMGTVADSKEQLFTVEYEQDGVMYIHKVRASSIEDAISKVKDDAHKVVVFTNQVLSEMGKNNSIGKYDRVVQAMRSLYSESLLPDDKLKELIRKKVPEYIKKYVKE